MTCMWAKLTELSSVQLTMVDTTCMWAKLTKLSSVQLTILDVTRMWTKLTKLNVQLTVTKLIIWLIAL